jgi:hypothetical protein
MLPRPRHRRRHAERGLDLYETPAPAVRALLDVETFEGPIWEPACGRGAVVRVSRDAAYKVIASDIAEHGCEDEAARVDFLKLDHTPRGLSAVSSPSRLPSSQQGAQPSALVRQAREPVLPVNVARVRAWRSRHPGCWRGRRDGGIAPQELSLTQHIGDTGKRADRTRSRLIGATCCSDSHNRPYGRHATTRCQAVHLPLLGLDPLLEGLARSRRRAALRQ